MKKAIWILWPSFIVAALAEFAFLVLFDPVELEIVGEVLGVSRLAAYSVGFLLFWLFTAASSAFTSYLQDSR